MHPHPSLPRRIILPLSTKSTYILTCPVLTLLRSYGQYIVGFGFGSEAGTESGTGGLRGEDGAEFVGVQWGAAVAWFLLKGLEMAFGEGGCCWGC